MEGQAGLLNRCGAVDEPGMDCAAHDRGLIEGYLAGKGAVTVDELMSIDGIERLRVYTILYRMEIEDGILEVLEREELGAPRIVRLDT